jgi:hypothetical protein
MKPPFVVPHGRIEAPQRKHRASSVGGSGFARHLAETGGDAAPAPVSEASETLPLDALLALQAVAEDGGEGARHAGRQHGETLLELLDRLRADLLGGRIAEAHLIELAGRVRARRGTSGDARLEQIINEIELRAEVELAKLTMRR